MAFSSIPAYNLDPSNWQQVPNHQLVDAEAINNSSSSFPPPALSTALQSHGPGDLIRPGSMAERARIANVPMPESALKCPRCESTNTKFCYFNNYTLTQPRYFCKTCRRYWTQGGALRNIPVGGGCRRNNKKSNKSNNSRSKVVGSSAGQTGGVGSAISGILPSSGGGSSADGLLISGWPVSPQLRFMAPNLAHHLGDHFGGLNNYKENTSMFGGAADLNFHATEHLGSDSGIFSGPSGPHPIGFYPFRGGFIDSSALNNGASQVGEKMLSSGPSHLASVKLEHNQELNLSRQFQGMAGNYEHQYSFSGAGSAWTSSSASLISSSSMNTNNAAWGDQML